MSRWSTVDHARAQGVLAFPEDAVARWQEAFAKEVVARVPEAIAVLRSPSEPRRAVVVIEPCDAAGHRHVLAAAKHCDPLSPGRTRIGVLSTKASLEGLVAVWQRGDVTAP